jgi:hypothetical protein
MSDRMDVVTFKETKNGKFFAVRLGSATQNKNGDGYNLYLYAMPAPIDGQFRLSIVPQRERGEAPAKGGGKAPEIDDSVPF